MGKGTTAGTDLGDAWVGALDVFGGQVEPAGGVRVDGRAVVAQGAPPLPAAPATLELPLRLETHAAAVPLGCALVQVHCGMYGEHRQVRVFLFKDNRLQATYPHRLSIKLQVHL